MAEPTHTRDDLQMFWMMIYAASIVNGCTPIGAKANANQAKADAEEMFDEDDDG